MHHTIQQTKSFNNQFDITLRSSKFCCPGYVVCIAYTKLCAFMNLSAPYLNTLFPIVQRVTNSSLAVICEAFCNGLLQHEEGLANADAFVNVCLQKVQFCGCRERRGQKIHKKKWSSSNFISRALSQSLSNYRGTAHAGILKAEVEVPLLTVLLYTR